LQSSELKRYEKSLKAALAAAGKIVKNGFARHGTVSYKSLVSPVTRVDVAAEKAIIKIIERAHPDHYFLGEESTYLKKRDLIGPKSFRWIIDPLDGTTNFVHGVPHSSVSIALEQNGTLLVGGVFDPFRNEMFTAVRGQGAYLNGKKIHVTRERKLIRSLMITGFPYDSISQAGKYVKLIAPILKRTMGLRRFGSAAIDLAWIACGRCEGYWEYNLSPWDVAAGYLLVQEAGGKVTNFSGGPANVNNPTQTLATNGLIHSELLTLFKSKQA
jgi:myo-inositol-1(or 4)-monophosphatase